MAISATHLHHLLPVSSSPRRSSPTSSAHARLPSSRSASAGPTNGTPGGTTPHPLSSSSGQIRHGPSSSLILRFPPNFVRQLSNKARRNCSNIGVAQVVAASWSNGPTDSPLASSTAVDSASAAVPAVEEAVVSAAAGRDDADGAAAVAGGGTAENVVESLSRAVREAQIFRSDGSLAVHAGERLGRDIHTDGITTPIVNTSAYYFKNSAQLIDFKEGRHTSFEYGRYGNPTTKVAEDKISALERAESTLFVASGMYATLVMMWALVPSGGHLVTTTDCYRKTRMLIENELPKLGISHTIIDPADMDSLESALDKHNVSLFFTESPTNPLFRCVDIELVSKLCHSKGALVCIDSTFASPINQKALTLGADIVLHSLTKFINGHNDVLGGCLCGSEELISRIRKYHHIFGGVINPNASSMILRGMKTLQLRVQKQNTTAMRMAQFLEEHPKITRVYYPGLPSNPEHHIAKRQMTGFGGVVSFEVAGDLWTTIRFIDSLNIAYNAPSFGGCESIVEQPAIMCYWDLANREKYGIKDNLIRLSLGIEDFEDLKEDIRQALEKV